MRKITALAALALASLLLSGCYRSFTISTDLADSMTLSGREMPAGDTQ